jgi:hypothetical protein
MRRENSTSIVPLLAALSHVTYPTFTSGIRIKSAEDKLTYPAFNSNSRNNLEKSLAQTYTVMGIVEAGKAQNRLLKLPNTR